MKRKPPAGTLAPPIPHPLVPPHVMARHPVDAALLWPGVYFLFDCDRVAYIGQSTCVSLRILEHRSGPMRFDSIAAIRAPLWRLDDLELAYIRWLRPRQNVAWNKVEDFGFYV